MVGNALNLAYPQPDAVRPDQPHKMCKMLGRDA